jgi:hypothetical protein
LQVCHEKELATAHCGFHCEALATRRLEMLKVAFLTTLSD